MLTSQGILCNHYSLVFPAQLISDELNINVSLQGNLKKRRESGLMTHKVGPKQRKGNDKEGIQTKCPIPPPAKGPFAKLVIRQQ